MMLQSFEIKVAMLGYVSVGKSTVINALFQDKYSEVSMRRTTAGINFFRVSAPCKKQEEKIKGGESDPPKRQQKNYKGKSSFASKTDLECDSSFSDDELEKVQDAMETHATIAKDNSVLRKENIIQEKTFDIELDKNIVEMRDDTKLVLVDIPGINEAGSSNIYLEYVAKHWETFDCVIVVMDAVQGVNTEEQIKLLEFVNTSVESRKNIPVIVLCNKVDDPDDEEMIELVDESRSKVEEIFQRTCRKQALQTILTGGSGCPDKSALFPAYIPVSAGNAFVYRTASRLKLDEFRTLDKEYIDKIGSDEVGRFKWKRLSNERKYETVFNVVNDPLQYSERLEATQFDKFLKVLSYAIGGDSVQKNLLEGQIEVALKNLKPGNSILDQLVIVYDRLKVLGKSTNHLKGKFWDLYKICESEALSDFTDNMNIVPVHRSIDQLISYANSFVRKIHFGDAVALEKEEELVIRAMQGLIKSELLIIQEKVSSWKFSHSRFLIDVGWYWNGRYNKQTGGNGYWQDKNDNIDCYTQKNTPPSDCLSHWKIIKTAEQNNGIPVWRNQYTNKKVEKKGNPAIPLAFKL